MTDKKLRVIAIGAGYFAQFQLRAWQRLPDVELVAIVEPDTHRHAELAGSYSGATLATSLTQALKQSPADIIDIITPPTTHLALIKEACKLAPQATIICQKPFCTDLPQAREAVELADSQPLVVHENFRFQPWYRQIKSLLDSRALGEVYQARFYLRPGDGQGPDAYLARQPYFRDMEKFLIHETGIHWVDVFRYLFGEPEAVYADLQRHNPAIKGEDSGHFVLHYASGLRAHFNGNRLLDHAAENTRLTMGTMTIEGSDASLSLQGSGAIEVRKHGELNSTPHTYSFNDTDFGGDCVYLLQQHVVEHLLQATPLHNTADAYLRNVELEAAIYQSAQTKALYQLNH
jgi:predicted dehydrogenase